METAVQTWSAMSDWMDRAGKHKRHERRDITDDEQASGWTHDTEDVSEELSSDGPVGRDVVRLPGKSSERGVRHAERDVVEDLPVVERLLDSSLLSLGVVEVLDKVADEPLVLRLLLEDESEAERVEQSPRERVEEVGDQEWAATERGEQHRHDGVGEQEDEQEVGRAEEVDVGQDDNVLSEESVEQVVHRDRLGPAPRSRL